MSPLSVVPFNPSVWNSQRSLYFHAAPPGPNSWLWSTSSQAWPADSKFLVVTFDVEKPIAVLPTNGTTSPDTVAALVVGAAKGSSALGRGLTLPTRSPTSAKVPSA